MSHIEIMIARAGEVIQSLSYTQPDDVFSIDSGTSAHISVLCKDT